MTDTFDKLPKRVKKFLNNHGDKKIIYSVVFRKPIEGIFQRIGNIMTLGMLKKRMSRLKYDKMYHLGMIVKFKNTSGYYVIEKNARIRAVRVKNLKKLLDSSDRMPLKLRTNLNEMFSKALANGLKVIYRHDSANCQNFIMELITADGSMTSKLKRFILQDVKYLMKKNPLTRSLINRLTDTGAFVEKTVQGGGSDSNETLEDIMN